MQHNNSFFDYYELHATTTDWENKFIKNPVGKKCRFCKKSYPQVSFSNKPHIVPELFGRNDITSNFECDFCNQYFQRFENDAATLIQHFLTLFSIKSKRGVPIFQSKKGTDAYSTILHVDGTQRKFNFNTNLDDFAYDKVNNIFTVNFRTKKFIPFHVYKVFLKISISLLDASDLIDNQHYLEILNNSSPVTTQQIFTAWRYRLKTKYFEIPVVSIYKAKNSKFENTQIPEYVFILYSGVLVFQMFLPFSTKNYTEHKEGNSMHLEIFPSFAMEKLEYIDKIEMNHFDLSCLEKVSITDQVKFYYDELIENHKS